MTVIVLRSAPDTTGIRFSLDARVVCVPDSSYANITGTLYVGEQRVSFYSLYKKIGFSLNYQNIVIHAVVRSSTDDEPHLYCQLDGPFPGCQSSVNGANESDEDSEDEEFAELKFYPSDTSQLDALFQAMSDCAAMNPDTDTDTDEDDGDESDVQAIDEFDPASFITSEDQLDQLTPQGRVLEHLESVIVTADTSHERFADAEDAEQE